MAKLRVGIEGKPGITEYSTYILAQQRTLGVLRELDTAISHKSNGTLGWFVLETHSNGTLAITLESRPKPQRPPKNKKDVTIPSDFGPRVTSAYVTGLDNLERGISPPYLSEFGLTRIGEVLERVRRDGAHGWRATAVDEDRTVDATENAQKSIRELLPVDQFALGSVEGTLETISIHGQTRFVVYHALTRKAVTCRFHGDEDLTAVLHAIGERVIASGRVQFNQRGEPMRVTTEDLRVLDATAFPTVAELAGHDPDFTDGLDSTDYVRSLRD
jgi:hypothetical protein